MSQQRSQARQEQSERDLALIRAQIDAIDAQMAALFEQRMLAAEAVVQCKANAQRPILDAERERTVLAQNAKHIQRMRFLPYYQDFMQNVMRLSKAHQEALRGTANRQE